MPIDVELYIQHTQGRGLVEVLLRGHLWVEQHLIGLLEAELKNPAAIKLDRMAFAQKVMLADALGLLAEDEVESMRVLNRMRNKLAHNLSGEPTPDDLLELEAALPRSQADLAFKILNFFGGSADPDVDLETRAARTLSSMVLALVTELEQHRLRHAYSREWGWKWRAGTSSTRSTSGRGRPRCPSRSTDASSASLTHPDPTPT